MAKLESMGVVEDSIGTQWVLESMVVVVDENIVGVGRQQVLGNAEC